MCNTCPYRNDSKYAYLRHEISMSALTEAARECHNTGTSDLAPKKGVPVKLCRGARDLQLRFFASLGFLNEATDEAWEAKRDELGV